MQLAPTTALAVPADQLARTTTPAHPPPWPSFQKPPCTQRISAGTRVMTMPELTHIIQRFLTPQHLVSAASICQAWHRAWIPILWRDLCFMRPRTTPLDYDHYFLSAECLLRHGHHARTLHASLLTTPELLRLAQHCSHLHTVTLQRALFSLKSLRQFLCASPGLRTFDLDWDWNLNDGDAVDHETPAGIGTNTDADTEDKNSDTDIERDSIEACNWIKTIECWASPHLEELVLRPQLSMKVLATDLRSLSRTLTCLRTVQLYEVDVEERILRRSKRRSGKERRSRQREDGSEQDSAATQQTLEVSSGSQTNAVSSSPSSSTGTTLSEAESSASSLEQQQLVNDSCRLEFLSINSSTTTTLAQLLQGCTHLRVLHLHRCEYLRDAALEAIAQYAPSVSDIALSTCRQLSAPGLQSFLRTKTRTRLEHVHFQDLDDAVDDETLTILATFHGESLRKLVCYYCAHFTDRGVQALLSAATGLKSLTLQSHRMTLALFFNPWACAPTLEYLELDGRFRRPKMTSSGRAPPTEVVPFVTLQNRIRTLTQLKDLRIWAGAFGNDLLQGFGPDVRIETLGLYWMSAEVTFSMEWATVRTGLPYLKRLYCELWERKGDLRALLAPLNVEVYPRRRPVYGVT